MYKIYSMPDCPWCDKAKQFLDDVGEDWKGVTINSATLRNKFLTDRGIEKPNRTWPRIFKIEDGEEVLVGGYNDLVSVFSEN